MDLAWLLEPTDVVTFKRDYWESKPLVSCANDGARFEGLLSLAAVDGILYHSSLRSDDVRIARNGESIPFRDLSRSAANDSEGGLEALYQEYRSESSIVLLFLHERWPPLKMLCQSLAREFSSRIQANMYLSPPQSQALKTHYDTHDVLVLQIHGKKRWRIFEGAVQLPLSHQRYTDDEDISLGSPTMEVTLSPGDLMYLPRGYPHDAASADGASLHLTIGVLPITWACNYKGCTIGDRCEPRIQAVSTSGIRIRSWSSCRECDPVDRVDDGHLARHRPRSCRGRGPRCRLARPPAVTCTTPARLGSGPSSRLEHATAL